MSVYPSASTMTVQAGPTTQDTTANKPNPNSNAHTPADSPTIALVHDLNSVVREIGLVNEAYKAIGFTFERSTGKLWWNRIAMTGCGSFSGQPKRGTKNGHVGARLGDIDSDSIRKEKDKDGFDSIVIGCKKKADGTRDNCFETWVVDDSHCNAHWKLVQIDSLEALKREITTTVTRQNGTQTQRTDQWVFEGRSSEVYIPTTGDDQGLQKAITILKSVILSR